jgi:hypothetical protein
MTGMFGWMMHVLEKTKIKAGMSNGLFQRA